MAHQIFRRMIVPAIELQSLEQGAMQLNEIPCAL